MSESSERHALHLGLAAVAGLAVVGFFVGTAQAPPSAPPLVLGQAQAIEGAEPAITYSEKRLAPPSSGSDWEANLALLARDGEGELSKEEALAERAARRAYDGAPPTIPHPVRQQEANACMACHEDGLNARGRLATPLPHDSYVSCTQCHVVSQAPMPGEALAPDATFAQNSFVGIASPTEGPRAWSIAPPQVPHHTQMRGECLSCHGPMGRQPLQSSHPDRQSCEQCHAASAQTDLRPGLEAPWQSP